MLYFSTMAFCVAMSLFSILVLKLYLDTFLHKPKGIRSIAGWLPFFIWQCLSETGCFPGNITLLFTFSTIVMVGLIVYTGPFWKRCVFPAVYLAIWMLLEGAVDFALRYFSGTVETEFLMISAPSKILLLLLSMGIRQFAKKKGIGKEPYGGGMVFMVLPIIGMLLYHTLYQLLQALYVNQSEIWVWMLLAAIALICLNLSFYPVYMQLVNNLQMKKNTHFYIKQMELFRQEKAMEEAAAIEIRQLRHDMRQHLIFVGELLENGTLESAQDALIELIGETRKRGRLESRTGNMVVDSMVNHVWKTAVENGIIFHADIAPLPELSIKDADLCVLLGNAFDNALEASRFVEDGRKEIWVAFQYIKGSLYIQIKNIYEGDVKLSADRKILSRKEESGHGFGLYSMERITEKYQGRMDIKSGGGLFTVEILIHC